MSLAAELARHKIRVNTLAPGVIRTPLVLVCRLAGGGRFGCDFIVAHVLTGPNPRINRVVTLLFPDRSRRERFFADEQYRAVRARWFEPSVSAVEVLQEVDGPELGAGDP